jgi:hypothetical protein
LGGGFAGLYAATYLDKTLARRADDGVGLGVVSFEPRSKNATKITFKLRSIFDPSISGQSADEYLLDFKRLVESQTPH